MKNYGLQLRIPPGQPKQNVATPPVTPPAFAFKDDDGADDVEREITRQAAKNRALKKVEEMHKKALGEDPSVFDYDGHYDEMKEKIARPRVQDKTERKSKYIETLMQKAKERECEHEINLDAFFSKYIETLMQKAKERVCEHEIIYEKKMLKERNKDDHLFADKEKFITRAYKEKLAERAKYLEEERLRQIREEKGDVTKKNDLSDFYFSLNKNVAFGAQLEESTKPSNQEGAADQTQGIKDSARTETTTHSPQGDNDHVQAGRHFRAHSQIGDASTTSEMAVENSTSPQETDWKPDEIEEEPPKQTAEVYKRTEDAVAVARERYLARKRARNQS